MNISGIRPYAGFYEYNSIKAAEIRNQQIAASQANSVPDSSPEDGAKALEAASPEQNFTSYDFAQTYQPGETYELKGVDSDINSLDVMKAVSDLDKDQVLRQYQYFVGNADGAVTKMQMEPMERIFRSGENFSL